MAGSDDVGGKADTTATDTEYDSVALESKLQTQLDALNEVDEHVDDEVVDDESDAEVKDDTDAEEEDDSQADQEDEESEDEDEDVEEDTESEDEEVVAEADDKPAKKSGKSPTLPDSYRRSLAAHGWTPEQVEDGLETGGHKFVEMSANIHAKRTAEIAQWAEVGRKAQQAEAVQQQAAQGPSVNGLPQTLQPIDLKKMQEKYGEAEMLEEIVGPVNSTIAALNSVLPQIQQGMQTIDQNNQDVATNHIHKFFDAKDMDPFRKFYGGADHERTAEQLEHRREVLEKATLIMAGARTMHRELTLDQALVEAHDSTASGFKEQSVRKSIKREVKKRNRGISQKPSKRGAKTGKSNSGPSKNASERERKIGALMRNVFK